MVWQLDAYCHMPTGQMNQKEAYGQDAESGVELRKKFKRATISGGSLRGARYSDLPDSDIRKYSKGYRGDPRFVQYCKQFVSLDESPIQEGTRVSPGPSSSEISSVKKFFRLMDGIGNRIKQFVQERFRGRWFSFGLLSCFLCIVISRPAFGRLCGRVFSLILRLCLRRIVGLISIVIDSVLEETAAQLEEALMTPPETIPTRDVPNHTGHPSTNSFSQLLMNGLCVVLGSLLHRTFQHAAQPVHPQHPWLAGN